MWFVDRYVSIVIITYGVMTVTFSFVIITNGVSIVTLSIVIVTYDLSSVVVSIVTITYEFSTFSFDWHFNVLFLDSYGFDCLL